MQEVGAVHGFKSAAMPGTRVESQTFGGECRSVEASFLSVIEISAVGDEAVDGTERHAACHLLAETQASLQRRATHTGERGDNPFCKSSGGRRQPSVCL